MDVRELKDKASQLFTKGKFAKAAEAYEEYCAADRKDHQARLRCGDAWAKAGKKDKAVGAYSAAAEGFAKDGFLPRAIAASKLVLEIDPTHKGVQKMLAELYAKKSGTSSGSSRGVGSSRSGVMPAATAHGAPGNDGDITRNVSTPVSTFQNRKDAIDLDSPVTKSGSVAPRKKPAAAETPSPMNRADALELPEYEIPMDDGPSTVGGIQTTKGPSPTRRADAIEIEVEDEGEKGPKALTETAIEIEVGGAPVAAAPIPGVELEIPIEGEPLPPSHNDQLPPELQIAVPIAPPPAASYELDVPVAPPPPPPQAAAPVYDLTDAIPDPKPSVPVYELTEELEEAPAPPPAAPPDDLALEVAAREAEASLVRRQNEKAAAEKAAAEEAAAAKAAAEKAAAESAAAAKAAAEKAAAEKAAAKAAAEKAAAEKAAAEKAAAEEVERRAAAAAARFAAEKAAADKAEAERLAAEKAAADQAEAERAASEKAAAEARRASVEVVAPPASEGAAPPGLKPRRSEPPAPVSSPSSRIWLPNSFSGPAAAAASSSGPSDASTDLERSLEAFARFDPDAPTPELDPSMAPDVPAPAAPVAAAPAPAAGSFTELDLEGDSLLHAVEAAAARAPSAAPAQTVSSPSGVVEEIMEAPEEHRPGGLPRIPLFSDLPEDAFIALFEKCPLQRFDEGQLVFEQGDKADAFYVICGGSVRVFRIDGGARKEIATLEEGSFFGEMALLSEAPRSASVEAAAEDTQVLAISAEILTELSAAHPSVATALKKFCRQRMLSNIMNHASIFSPFNKSDRRDLVQRFRAREVKTGDVVIKQGATSDGLYVVLSGEVEVDAAGRRIATLKEGEVFGEMSLLTRSPASATVRAMRHTSLLRLPKSDFDQLILSHPQVLEHVSVLIDERKKADAKRASAEQMI